MNGVWLNVSGGQLCLDGFINLDISQHDGRKLKLHRLSKYLDHSVDGIYCNHFIDNLTKTNTLIFLRECRRLLKFGKVLRLIVDEGKFKEDDLIYTAQMSGLEPIKTCEHCRSDIKEFDGLESNDFPELILEFILPDRSMCKKPLVSVLIPTFRATWFKQALHAAQSQTYANIEIIISDDSPNDDIKQIVRSLSEGDERINYIRNNPALGPVGNHLQLFSRAKGEFIKYLNDDDLLVSTCIEKMLQAFREHHSVTLVTSHRKCIDEKGLELLETARTKALSKRDCELEGVSYANTLIQLQRNLIGEPTTVMFRKSDLVWVRPNLVAFGGVVGMGSGDVAMWLNLLGRGNAFYIAESLSYFRIHEGQLQNEPWLRKAAFNTWMGYIKNGKNLGLVQKRIVWNIKRRYASDGRWGSLQMVTTEAFYMLMKRYYRLTVRLILNSIIKFCKNRKP